MPSTCPEGVTLSEYAWIKNRKCKFQDGFDKGGAALKDYVLDCVASDGFVVRVGKDQGFEYALGVFNGTDVNPVFSGYEVVAPTQGRAR